MEGTVKWFNRSKGFGFVEGKDGKDYFVHYTAVKEGTFIRDEDLVSFEPAETDKGLQAQNVTLLTKASDLGGQSSAPEQETEDAVEESEEEPEVVETAEDSEDFGEEEATEEEPEAEEKKKK
ncbi:cold shock domain-containing protein [Candidatus Woesearchaeota archaeon]|nr:cold shock domain-containing protein [Candidatus Woesearchaeota archaeon]